MSKTPFLLLVLAVFLLEGRHAAADESSEPAVADSVLAATRDRATLIRLRDGRELAGMPLAFDEQTLTFAISGTGQVVSVPRAEVVAVSLPGAKNVAPTPVEQQAPARKRHVGLLLYQGPGNVMVDVDYGHFYGFVGTSIGYPIIFSGDLHNTDSSGDSQYVGGVLGLGGTWKLSARNNWQFDLTGTLTPTWWGGFSMGIGVSAGFHYTAPSGFTVGFKIPVFGVAPGCSSLFGEYDNKSGCRQVTTGANLIGNYYLQAGMSLPIVSLGYRF